MRALQVLSLFAAASLLTHCSSGDDSPPPYQTSATVGTTAASGSGSGGGGDGGSGGETTEGRFAALVDAIQDERAAFGDPGVAVAVIEKGEVTFAQGFGSKDPKGDDPVLPTTLFRIGSVTKMLTAAALLSEVAASHVAIASPVTAYVPSFDFAGDPSWAPSIIVQHALTHTSGMVDYLEIDVPQSQQGDGALAEYMTNDFGNLAYLMVPAGTFYNYSNPNFYLAGLVAETTSGIPYRTLMKQRVFAPLGMDRTFFLASEVQADGDYALGSTTYPGVPTTVKPDSYENAWARPAGYAFSSVLDLAQFVNFLNKGDPNVLTEELRGAMSVPSVDTHEFLDYIGYGYGLFVINHAFLGSSDEVYPLTIVSHGGDIPGFAADVFLVPSLDFGFVSLSNTDGAHFVQSFVTALTSLNTLPDPEPAPDLTMSDAKLATYAGNYYEDFGYGDIYITQSGSALNISMPVLDSLSIPYDGKLTPIAPDNFYFLVQGIPLQVTFFPDDLGITRYLRTRAFVGIRTDAITTHVPSPTELSRDFVVQQLARARDAARGGQRLGHPALPTH